jgi:hypothetical protein
VLDYAVPEYRIVECPTCGELYDWHSLNIRTECPNPSCKADKCYDRETVKRLREAKSG